MDRWARDILERFEARADEVADEIADATVAEVPGFGPGNNAILRAEVRGLARRHLDAFLHAARSGSPPDPTIIAIARERAALRAVEMVPLAALLHSYLIAQRVITAAIARETGTDALSRGAALALTAKTFDSTSRSLQRWRTPMSKSRRAPWPISIQRGAASLTP